MKYLQSVPNIAGGDLTVKGTRIRISQVFRMMANGVTLQYMAAEWWPWLPLETLRGAVDEAINQLESGENLPHAHA